MVTLLHAGAQGAEGRGVVAEGHSKGRSGVEARFKLVGRVWGSRGRQGRDGTRGGGGSGGGHTGSSRPVLGVWTETTAWGTPSQRARLQTGCCASAAAPVDCPALLP